METSTYVSPYDVQNRETIENYKKEKGIKKSEDMNAYMVYVSVSTNHDDPFFFIASTDTRTTDVDFNQLTNSFVSRKSNECNPSDDNFKCWVKTQRKLGYGVIARLLGIYSKEEYTRNSAKRAALKKAEKMFPTKKLAGGMGDRRNRRRKD